MDEQNKRAIDKAHSLLRKGEHIHYLVYFGSHLYGTSDVNSDLDLKGLFQPSPNDLILRNYRKSINWKSGSDDDKNSKDDIDIELWSLHYFFEILGKGDTNAVDLLFSNTNKDCIIKNNWFVLQPIFNNPLSLFDPKSTESFTHYAIGQAKKYGIKGSRLGILKRIYRYLKNNIITLEGRRLREISDSIVYHFYDPSFCFLKEINNEDALVICGKTHLLSISLEEFYKRIEREYKKYGIRAEKAERGEGIDWKACSHAVRAIEQNKELLKNGKIDFPLKSAGYIKDIKDGKLPWKEFEEIISKGIEEVDRLSKRESSYSGEFDKNLIDTFLLELYSSTLGINLHHLI